MFIEEIFPNLLRFFKNSLFVRFTIIDGPDILKLLVFKSMREYFKLFNII